MLDFASSEPAQVSNHQGDTAGRTVLILVTLSGGSELRIATIVCTKAESLSKSMTSLETMSTFTQYAVF